jgi:transposase-like protein
MAPQRRNRYDELFKKKAVARHIENHCTLAESAAGLGVTPGMLSKWIKWYSPEQASPAMDCEAEIKQMKGEIKMLKEIVGKAFLQKFTVDEIAERMIDEPEKFLAVAEDPPGHAKPAQ